MVCVGYQNEVCSSEIFQWNMLLCKCVNDQLLSCEANKINRMNEEISNANKLLCCVNILTPKSFGFNSYFVDTFHFLSSSVREQLRPGRRT